MKLGETTRELGADPGSWGSSGGQQSHKCEASGRVSASISCRAPCQRLPFPAIALLLPCYCPAIALPASRRRACAPSQCVLNVLPEGAERARRILRRQREE